MRNLCTAFVCFATLATSATLARADKIERTWQAKCSSCHGDSGNGQTAKGKVMGVSDLSSAAVQKDLTDGQIQKAIEDGVNTTSKDGKKQQMDAYKDKLKPEQITALVAYTRTLAGK